MTGEHGAREVTATWVHDDTLLDLQLAGGASVTTTANHRLWNHTDQRWEPADTLDPGVHLLTPDGGTITVVGLDPTTAHTAPAHNLTINDLNTYYVLAGDTPVLVHNAAHNRPRPGCGYTSQGVKRHNPADWRRTRDLWDELGYGDILSPANRQRIAAGRTPIVDDHWIRYFPGDALLRGQRITMHHIGGGPITVPLPTSRHLTAHMPGGFRYNPGGPGSSG